MFTFKKEDVRKEPWKPSKCIF